MGFSLTATLVVDGLVDKLSAGGRELASASIKLTKAIAFGSGIGPGQADVYTSFLRSALTVSGNDDWDLRGGSALVDQFGVAFSIVRLKGLIVVAEGVTEVANTHDVIVGNAAANGWVGPWGAATHKLSLPPGMYLPLIHPGVGPNDGWAVTAGTGDILRITNAGAVSTVAYQMLIWGSSS